MTTDPLSKASLRRHALARRDLIEPAEAQAAARSVCARAMALLREKAAPPAVVAAYWPIRSEMPTRPLLEALAAAGYRTALPAMTGAGRPLRFRAWSPGDELHKGPLGLSEPAPGAPEVEPDVVFTPLACFDARGYRIGYGGGNFDATLEALRARRKILAIGLAYADQEVAAAPHEAHDQRLDHVVTEQNTRSTGD